jgi:hypothetical protein
MGFSLAVAQIYVPPSIRKRKLQELFQATAEAFQYPAPPLSSLTIREILIRYASFTSERAKESIQQRRETEVNYPPASWEAS